MTNSQLLQLLCTKYNYTQNIIETYMKGCRTDKKRREFLEKLLNISENGIDKQRLRYFNT